MTRACRGLAAVLAVLAFQAASAGEPRKFAVVSLVGDRISIVNHVGETGTRVDRNRRETVEMPPNVLDNAIVAAIDRAVREERKEADVVMLAGTEDLYAKQGDPVEDPDVAPVANAIRPAVASSGVTHLILVTKLRHEAVLRMQHGSMGSGKLEGVGFYLDHAMRTQRTDTGASGQGMLAPYAYFRVSLVDLSGTSPVAHEDVLASTTVSQARAPSLRVWESLTAEQKVRLINGMTRQEAAKAAAKLVRSLP